MLRDEDTKPARGPGRPRKQGTGARVRAAAREEVAERGLNDVTLASIARRAGVPKSTVYLRWPSVLDLLAEATVEVVDYGHVPDGGSLRTDLRTLADRLMRTSMTPPLLELHLQFSAMDAGAPPTYRKFQETAVAIGMERAGIVFERGRERGEIREDIDIVVTTRVFLGAVMMEALMAPGHHVSDDALDAVIDLFVDGLMKPI